MNAASSEPLSFFPVENVCFDVPSSDKKIIISHLVGVAVQGLGLSEEEGSELCARIMEREGNGSTGVGQIAIPHVKSEKVTRTVAAMGVFPDGVDFTAVDGESVHSVFLLISPPDHADEHVHILRWIAGLARQRDFPRFVRQTSTSEEARSLLEELGG